MDRNDEPESDWVFPSAGSGQAQSLTKPGMAWSPSIDIKARGNDLVVTMGLPDIKPENIEIQAEGNQLIVRGEYDNEQSDDSEGYKIAGRSHGSFYRSLPLPTGVDASKARTAYAHGKLHVTIPQAAQDVPWINKGKLSEESIQDKPTEITTGKIST